MLEEEEMTLSFSRVRLALGLVAALVLLAVGTAGASAASPPFEPIALKRIPLPKDLSTNDPAFAADGGHLLFAAKRAGDTQHQLWIADLQGKDAHCITCSGPAVPDVNYVNPFPDGKRIF